VTIGNGLPDFPNTVVRERIHDWQPRDPDAGSVVGTDGFGYKWDSKLKQHVKIPHIGTVVN